MAHMAEFRGVLFDPRCVDILSRSRNRIESICARHPVRTVVADTP
jgi:response regulator RpfG family c-di-GMP phosphodiesterase